MLCVRRGDVECWAGEERIVCLTRDVLGLHLGGGDAIDMVFDCSVTLVRLDRLFPNLSFLCIPRTVEVIGNRCLWGHKKLRTVVFERNSALREIEEWAFSQCAITSIELPRSLVTIGEGCFYDCGCIDVVTFEPCCQIARLGEFAFSCSVRSIMVPASVRVIGRMCFCSWKFDHVTFEPGSRLVRMEERAFHMSRIETIMIPPTVEFIGEACFAFCQQLRFIGLDDDSMLTTISDDAFKKTDISYFKIPVHVATIGTNVFDGCHIVRVDIADGNKHFVIRDPFVIDAAGTNIVTCFRELPRYCIPSEIEDISDGCFLYMSMIQHLEFESSKILVICANLFNGSAIQQICIPSSVLMLSSNCFDFTQNLVSVVFEAESQCVVLGPCAFQYSGITDVNIPASVVSIGDSCFCGSKLQHVTFEVNSQLVSIGDRAFSYCSSLAGELAIPSSVQIIGKSAFCNCQMITSVIVDSDSLLSVIDEQAFRSCGRLERFILPDQVRRIAPLAFCETQFDEFTVNLSNEHCAKIGSLLADKAISAAVACVGNGIQECVIPSTVKVIEQGCFMKRPVREITFDGRSSLQEIQRDAFRECDLAKFTVPASVEIIGDSSFRDCQHLVSVIFEHGSMLREIQSSAFRKTRIATLELPRSLTVLGNCAISHITREVSFPEGTKHFICQNSMVLGQDGTVALCLYDYNESLDFDGKCSYVVPADVEVIAREFFYVLDFSEAAEISFEQQSRLCYISSRSFFNVNIQAITIPASVLVIEDEAFSCSTVREVNFAQDSQLLKIGRDAFIHAGLTQITIPASVVAISVGCFFRCMDLMEVNFEVPSQLTYVGRNAFEEIPAEVCLPLTVQYCDIR